MNVRLDLILVKRMLARTRSHAQQMIRDGWVGIDGVTIDSPGHLVDESKNPKIVIADESHYVSRAAVKLKGAIEHFQITIEGKDCLDLGLSTGGFSQVLLESGAKSVVGVDVSPEQIAKILVNHPRLIILPPQNARDLQSSNLPELHKDFDIIVADVSFISIKLLIPKFVQFARKGCRFLFLVKPQFELGSHKLNKRGVVTDLTLFHDLKKEIEQLLNDLGIRFAGFVDSSIKGGDGNVEFFCCAQTPD